MPTGNVLEMYLQYVMCWELVRWRIFLSYTKWVLHPCMFGPHKTKFCLKAYLKRGLKPLNDSSHHNQAIGGYSQTVLIGPVHALNHGAIHIQGQPSRGDTDGHTVPSSIGQHCHGEPGNNRRTGFEHTTFSFFDRMGYTNHMLKYRRTGRVRRTQGK